MIRMFIHLKFIMSLVQQGPITFTFGFIFFQILPRYYIWFYFRLSTIVYVYT